MTVDEAYKDVKHGKDCVVCPATDSDDPEVENFWAKLVRLWDDIV